MALATYSDLKQSILDWTARDDLTTKTDDFIDLAEAYFNNFFADKQMFATTTIATVGGTSLYDLPADNLQLQRVAVSGSPMRLQSCDAGWADAQYLDSSTGLPVYYTTDVPSGKIKLYPTPDGAYTLNITYLQKIPALTSVNTTNWLLTSAPYIYLHGCLFYAYQYTKDLENATAQQSLLSALLDSLELNYKQSALQYSGYGLAMRVDKRGVV